MADQNSPRKPEAIQVNTLDDMSRGRYSNNMIITHTPDEFVIDWLLNSPSGMHLVSRVIISPGHMKRVIGALTENMARYENTFGPVRVIEAKDQRFG